MTFEDILTIFMIIVAVFCAIVIILVIVDLIVEAIKLSKMKENEDNIRYVKICDEETTTEEIMEETIEEVVEETVVEKAEEVKEQTTEVAVETKHPALPFITIENRGKYTLKVNANVVGNDDLSKTVITADDVVKVKF